jgi:hypothetical protein
LVTVALAGAINNSLNIIIKPFQKCQDKNNALLGVSQAPSRILFYEYII